MVANSFKTTTGTQAWDLATNWTAGVPQPGDDVSIVVPMSEYTTVAIAATDPAYTVGSLTYTGALSASSTVEQIIDSGSLTVTGATAINAGLISLVNNGSLVLQGQTTLSNYSDIFVGGTMPGYLTAGLVQGTSIDHLSVSLGTASVAQIQGSLSLDVSSGGTLTVGGTSGSGFYGLNGGKLVLGTAATSLSDTIDPTSRSLIDLSNVPYQNGETTKITLNSVQAGYSIYTVQLLSATNAALFTFNSVDSMTTPVFSVSSDAANGTLVSVACYRAGTLILTDTGEVDVVSLSIGDNVVTVDGSVQPIVWLGRRSYAGRFLAANPKVQPIRFQAGSLGNGLPRRDLLVSPEHAMFLDGVLVPARYLANGATIYQEADLDRVDYFHIELDNHDVILAEGAPSETFVDDDSRGMFHNAAEYRQLYPDAPEPDGFCAPRVENGYQLEAIRRRLGLIAGELATAACTQSSLAVATEGLQYFRR